MKQFLTALLIFALGVAAGHYGTLVLWQPRYDEAGHAEFCRLMTKEAPARARENTYAICMVAPVVRQGFTR
jgi:hypothetical protein